MMSIDEEVKSLVAFLSHPAGFDVDMCGMLCIRPIDECCPPKRWEVDWEDPEGQHYKAFNDLQSAADFFVRLRHEQELGIDFEFEYWEKININCYGTVFRP